MNEAAAETNQSVTIEQKRAALDSALHSQTFARADQLKSFLKYVCEMEIAGRGQELTEYLIGIEALGRPSNYSPGDDSAVRNRAFALRKKLQEFYEHERPDTAIRIELLKGSYCPHFIGNHFPAKLNGATALSPTNEQLLELPASIGLSTNTEIEEPHSERTKWLFGFLAGVVATAVIAGTIYLLPGRKASTSLTHEIAPILTEAWGPIFSANADVLVCVANPPSFSVHQSATPMPSLPVTTTSFNDPGGQPLPQQLQEWYRKKYPTPAETNLYLTITTNATYWGDSLGAITVSKTLHAAKIPHQIFPEKLITVPTMRHRNAVLFGAPEYSPAVSHFLERCPLTIDFLTAVTSHEPGQPPTPLYRLKRDTSSRLVQVYGLITVLPSESATDHQRRTIIFSGVNSAGTQAAAEFFTSQEHLAELKKQLNNDGHSTFPPAYQVVVRSETDDNMLLNFRYETYRIIPTPLSH